ncbi:TIGR01777 family oxidoreductase [Algibacter sp. L4_22]|uniref:TIGR01777 family oxidoreductase n=1 Tax=Algibacter sp. L4_22 TaxID=2942477 RepID=UPI00201B5FF8|nr:TIGR01777 family oxidoreductase [Algibacter sp. L4_22]MCL5128824.1 TIGR01777 family oxidoreductase [Algibacter sp. L4_22]
MRVLITGATGLIGQEIVSLCHAENIKVNFLTTSKSKLVKNENYQGFLWNPDAKEIDLDCFKNVDAIINLAGATISKRWTDSYKKIILSSRKDSAELLFESLKNTPHNVQQIVSASAIGLYPDSLTNYYTEDFKITSANSFLSEVVNVWETAVDRFSELNIKVTKIRTGLVLAENGGALAEMIKPIKLGLGSAFGSGKQWQSWIHIEDLSEIFLFTLLEKLEGVFNAVAPNPTTNYELTKSIATTLERPFFLPKIPKFAMKLVLGEMHLLLFESQRVSSKKIEDAGFDFKFHHLQPALDNLLN